MTTYGMTRAGGEVRHIFGPRNPDPRYVPIALCGARLVAEINIDAPTDFRFWPLCKTCEKASQRTRRAS